MRIVLLSSVNTFPTKTRMSKLAHAHGCKTLSSNPKFCECHLSKEEKEERVMADKFVKFCGAAEHGYFEIVKEWIEKEQIVGKTAESRTTEQQTQLNKALFCALHGQETKIASYLLEQKASAEAVLVQIGLASCKPEVFDLLLAHVPKAKHNEYIQSVFHHCVSPGNVCLGKYLLSLGAQESYQRDIATMEFMSSTK